MSSGQHATACPLGHWIASYLIKDMVGLSSDEHATLEKLIPLDLRD
jgi:hypothetical protein